MLYLDSSLNGPIPSNEFPQATGRRVVASEYLDCELFLTGRGQARLSVAGKDYSGRPALDAALERQLLELDLEPAQYGAHLFQALFPDGDDLLAGYRESLAIAGHESKRLRLRLHVAASAPPALQDLHWELLYDRRRQIALGHSQEIAFSRYLGVALEPGRAVIGQPRLLVVLSCPRDLADYDLPVVERDTLLRALEQALVPLEGLMAWEFFEGPATIERIRDRLVAGRFHALHLAAHGLLPPDEPTARLVLETGDRRASFIDEKLFSAAFADQESLRLVSLIACNGGAPTGREPFSGLAPALVRRGVPAVVAMRRQISLDGATRFTEHFYRNLARSAQVDVAVNEARLQLYLGEPDSPEWGTPALFMRLAQGRLWRSPSQGVEAGPDSRGADSEIAGQDAGSQAGAAVVKALLLSELVDRTRLAEELGDRRMAEIFNQYDRIVHGLLREHEGREASHADGFLMLFDRPFDAVGWALAFHQAMADLSREVGVELAFRVAIHLGEVMLLKTPPEEVASDTGPLVVEGVARPHAARLMSMARGGQTLLSAAAFDVARRSAVGTAADKLCWMAHGEYLPAGTQVPVAVYEVGASGSAPLAAPADTEDVRRAAGDVTILGWRPAVGLEVPQRRKWVLEKKLSEGGFGEVWLAGREKIRRRRVFKFCFEVERLKALQREITLFRLLKGELGDRDDIARILDWNFEQAPYFIESEYAADGNLVEWAEEQGGIAAVPMARRLEIVAQLATALAAAHSVGVLHKDVKPANVLIASGSDGRLQVRLADFGIGAVTERERLAAAGITVLGLTGKTEEESSSYSGTRLYVAPEVLEGKQATLQADVYALGVVLYQAVVGDFTKALAPGWQRDVADELLGEDIALAVDGSPERRLSNALRFAERLRSLEDRRREREEARRVQESQTRLLRKLRAIVIVTLLIFASTMAYLASRVTVEAERANREADHAQQVLRFTMDLFKWSGSGAKINISEVPAKDILDRGAEMIRNEFSYQPATQALLMDTIGAVYLQSGLYRSAQPLLEKALEIRREHLGEEDPDVAKSLLSVADIYQEQGRYSAAEVRLRQSLRILEKVRAPEDPDLVKGIRSLGVVYWRQGNHEAAQAQYQRVLRILEEAGRSNDPETARALNNLGIVYDYQGLHKEAQSAYERALRILEDKDDLSSLLMARVFTNLGILYQKQGDGQQAESSYRRALELQRGILKPGHPGLLKTMNNLALLYIDQGLYGEAEELLLSNLEAKKSVYGTEHPSVAKGMNSLADVYLEQGRDEDAERYYQGALEIFEKVLEPEHPDVSYPLHWLAVIHHDRQLNSAAEGYFRRALAIREQARHPRLDATRRAYAKLLRAMQRDDEARELESRIGKALETA